jgi:hypothetical protein
MKQFSTGTGVAVLGVCILAATVVATQRGGSEAFAQGTGGDRQIVAQGVYGASGPNYYNELGHWGYRIWSDNTTEVKFLGLTRGQNNGGSLSTWVAAEPWISAWQTVDTGTAAFFASDVDRSGSIDSGDISAVLLDFNNTTDPTTPPPIDCNINAPR